MLELLPVLLTAVALVGYAAAILRLARRGVRWPVARTACLLAGSACVGVALLPPMAGSDELFPVHIGQHLLLGMAAPALFALSGPITLALRALPAAPRRSLVAVLHSPAVRIVTAPVTALVLDVGGLYVLYLTGVYARAQGDDVVHALVHLHMFLAGCLLSWAIIGVDPIRRRAGTAVRLTVLVLAGAAHDTLSKLLYAHDLPAGGGTIAERHAGAELMYYGGTVVDVAIAAVLMTQWWRATGRTLAAERRRAAQAR